MVPAGYNRDDFPLELPEYSYTLERFGDTDPRLSILIAGLYCRLDLRRQLMTGLEPQLRQGAEVVIITDTGAMPAGAKRQLLLNSSRGDYVATVDDDDTVSANYVESILTGTDKSPDVVTFDLDYQSPARKARWVFKLNGIDAKPLGQHTVEMAANHLCAWRREIAIAVPFCPIWYLDDVFWYRALHAAGLGQTSAHVLAEPLYFYQFHPDTTANQAVARRRYTEAWALNGVDVFRMDTGQVAVAAWSRAGNNGSTTAVRLPGGKTEIVNNDRLTLLTTLHVP